MTYREIPVLLLLGRSDNVEVGLDGNSIGAKSRPLIRLVFRELRRRRELLRGRGRGAAELHRHLGGKDVSDREDVSGGKADESKG